MQNWKRRMIKILPERDQVRIELSQTDDPMYMWKSILYLSNSKSEENDEEFFSHIFKELLFYLEAGESDGSHAEHDYYTAAVHGFAKSILSIKRVERYIVKYIPKEKFVKFKNIFEYESNRKYMKILNCYGQS